MIDFFSIISGSSGNCSYISDGRTALLTDCGMSGKKLIEALNSRYIPIDKISAILVTHEHLDHIKGVGVIARKYNIPIYATAPTHSAMDIGKVSDELRFEVKPFSDFFVGSIGVHPFSIPHDAKGPVGYSFYIDEKKYCIATDMGAVSTDLFNELKGCHSIILESNHDIQMLQYGSYPYPLKRRILGEYGHLSNEAASRVAVSLAKSGTKNIMLGHLSIENNRPEIAMLETFNALNDADIKVGGDVTLTVADRYKITDFGGAL